MFTHSWFPPHTSSLLFFCLNIKQHTSACFKFQNSKKKFPQYKLQLASPLCKALMQRYRHATTKLQQYKLVTSCIAIQFNDSRNHFSQMSNIFLAFSGINSQPESFDPFYQLGLVFWLHFPSDELFQFMPKIFNWIGIRRFWWRPPPIDTI